MFFVVVAELSSQFDSLPNGDLIPYAIHSGPSYPPVRHYFADWSLPTVRPPLPGTPFRYPPFIEPRLHARSRSPPPAWNSESRVLGYKLAEVRFIELIPINNPNIRFEIRKYSFPRDKQIKVKGTLQVFQRITTEEKLVLSTPKGDVFAIFDRNNKILRGIYIIRYQNSRQTAKRVKINMENGAIQCMTLQETQVSALGKYYPISRNFKTEIIDPFHLHH